MRRIGTLVLALGFLALGNRASAQVDCTAGCTTTKYGLGVNPNFKITDVPFDNFKFTHSDFGPNLGGISYYYNRGDQTGANQQICDVERIFNPLPGQVILREQTACTPTSEGPKCTGGANAGKSCHLNASAQFATIECPGSTCAESAGTSCRVEIPLSDGGKTPPANTSEYWILTLNNNPIYNLSAMTGNTFGGTSAQKECLNAGSQLRQACTTDADCGAGAPAGSCAACYPTFIRQKPSMATRYAFPASRCVSNGYPLPCCTGAGTGSCSGSSYLRWDKGLPQGTAGDPNNPRIAQSTAFRLHQDDAAVCCSGPSAAFCSGNPFPFSPYPVLWRPDCTAPRAVRTLINEDNIVPDWVFEAGKASRFFTDPEFVLPGEQFGVCTNNRDTACTATGNECASLSDTCDLRERGIRIQVLPQQIADANGDPVPTACGSALAVLRGSPSANCTLEPRYPVDGDPGSDCGVLNYGVDQRTDLNCDGVADTPLDRCPFLSEWNQPLDTDGDCSPLVGGQLPPTCRGDECECGDSDLNGRVNVADLVKTNIMIFTGVGDRRADANSDLLINVSDIVSANQEIFTPDSSTCRQITSIRCGNNIRDPGEACDNGAKCQGGTQAGQACDATGINTCQGGGQCVRVGGDGCNRACRVEAGWTCTGNVGQPSVCTHN